LSLLAQDTHLTRRVGAIGLVVLGLAIVFFVFVYDQIEWGSHTRVRIYFHSTGGLAEGAPFVVAGKAVGKIESIALSPRGANTPLGGDEGVAVTVAIETRWARRIVRGGDVFVTSRGALSGKYLEVGPAPQPGPTLRDGDELIGRDPPSLDRVLQRTWDNLMTTRQFAEAVGPEIRALRAELDGLQKTLDEIAPEVKLRDDIGALIDEGRRTYAALGGEQGITRMGVVMDRGTSTIAQARDTIARLRAGADTLTESLGSLRGRMGVKGSEAIDKVGLAIDRVKAVIDKVDPLLAHIDAIQQHIARGDGSLLKLANDPEFPEDAKELGKILKRQPWRLLERPPK
jgi:ABC-type transporter Mla subunit MlaD